MPVFTDFSGRNVGPFERLETPETLEQLRAVARDAGQSRVHAVGSAWAFSAPAYCEGVIVDTTRLAAFLEHLEPAVRQPADGRRVFAWVEAGIKVRNLNLALDGRQRADGRPGLSDAFRRGRAFTPPTLGGAGGQSLAGAINTGTHGGDVGRPPIGDYVRAMLVVGSGGELRLMQPEPGVVDVAQLRALLRTDVRDVTGTEAFDAAVCSVGRFGIVYAYLFEVHDESTVAVVEHRRVLTWSEVRPMIADPAQIASTAARDEFLMVVINPVKEAKGDRRCFLTRHRTVPVTPFQPLPASIPNAGAGFGLPGLNSTSVVAERRGIPPLVGQQLCLERQTDGTRAASAVLRALGWVYCVLMFPVGLAFGIPLLRAADAIDKIGPGYKIGDAAAEILNQWTASGVPQLLEAVNRMLLESGQSGSRPSDGQAWLVHGRRWEIADFFDYENDCYRGDSVELFFPAGAQLPAKVEEVFRVFDDLRQSGVAVGAYIALRFMSPTRSLIGPAGFHPHTCSIEVSMLRGLLLNTEALTRLQKVALDGGGRIHWGQENDLAPVEVQSIYGGSLTTWRQRLAELEGRSGVFRTPFTVRHGLEPVWPPSWAGWEDTGLIASSSPGVVSAGGGQALEVFALDLGRAVAAQRRPAAAPAGWRLIRSEQRALGATPQPVRAVDGRVELFIRDSGDSLAHCWEDRAGSGIYSSWDVRWGPRIQGDPQPTAHGDGRLEVFAHEFDSFRRRLLHSYQRWLGGPWSANEVLGEEPIVRRPGACLRRFGPSDFLLAVAADDTGNVIFKAQLGPGGDSAWGAWTLLMPKGGDVANAPGTGSPIAVAVTGPGGQVRVFAIDGRGQVQEALEATQGVSVTWNAWRALPPLPGGARLDGGSRLAAVQSASLWLFGRSEDGSAMTIAFTPGGGWSGWIELGGNILGDLACGVLDDGRVEVFGRRAADSRLMARRMIAPGRWL